MEMKDRLDELNRLSGELPPVNHDTFEHWMKMETHYAELEHHWANHVHDYVWAARCNQLRWRCLQLALDSLLNRQVKPQ